MLRVEKGVFFAELKFDNTLTRYECLLTVCPDPVCTCWIIKLDLLNMADKEDSAKQLSINLQKKELVYENELPDQAEIDFNRQFLESLTEKDFTILSKSFSAVKNQLTETSNMSSLNPDFPKAAEENMTVGYNEVLPFGNQISVKLHGRQYVILDQYCTTPGCKCSDVYVSVYHGDTAEPGKEVAVFWIDYKERLWNLIEYNINNESGFNSNELKKAITARYPKFYKILKKRHQKLKLLYINYRKKTIFTSPFGIEKASISRNDLCPCGSGLKYKYCCLGKERTQTA